MNWRHTLISSGITLIVTLAAGLLVYYLTKEPPPLLPSEQIIYRVNTSATFGTDQDKITFLTIRVENTGNKAAHNVRIVDIFSDRYIIQSKQIELSSGPASNVIDNSSEHKVDIVMPILVPNEYAAISLLIRGPSGLEPNVNVRSDESVGKMATNSLQPIANEINADKQKAIISAVTGVLFGLVGLVITGALLARIRRGGASRNNTAFVYLQQGLTEEARELLSAAIADGDGEAVTVANLGAALGLQGDVEGARKRFLIAEWWAAPGRWTNRHARAVIAYDQATLLIHNSDLAGAMEELRKAFSLSRRQIGRYCDLSIYMKDVKEKNAEFRELIERRGKKPVSVS